MSRVQVRLPGAPPIIAPKARRAIQRSEARGRPAGAIPGPEARRHDTEEDRAAAAVAVSGPKAGSAPRQQ
ncbi:MAG: hypothetical protein L0215_18760 [Gemmataceae bacterium]|nr:hypothetical protein [Gemmataceae bacterium]